MFLHSHWGFFYQYQYIKTYYYYYPYATQVSHRAAGAGLV